MGKESFEKIIKLNKIKQLTILLVEQNAKLEMKVSDYTYVVDQGLISLEGPSSELHENQHVIQSYLGKFTNKKLSS